MPREDWVTQPPEFLNHFKGYVSSCIWTDNISPQIELEFTVTEIIDPPDLATQKATCWYSAGKKGEWVVDPDGRSIRAVKEGKKFAQGSKYGMLIDATTQIDTAEAPIPVLDGDPRDSNVWLFQGFEMKREELRIPEAFLEARKEEGKTQKETTSFVRPLAYLGQWDGQQFVMLEGSKSTGAAPTTSNSNILEQLDPETIEKLATLAKGKNDGLLRIAAKRDADLGKPEIMDALINKNLMGEMEAIGAVSKGADGKYQ